MSQSEAVHAAVGVLVVHNHDCRIVDANEGRVVSGGGLFECWT